MDGEMSAPLAHRYHVVEVPVVGGRLHVGVWEAEVDDAPTVVLIHGVTASHLAWQWVAEALPDVRLVAPDLRGRGRSNGVTGPAGMGVHADDLAAVLTHLQVEPTVVVGHSMGAFVSVVFAHRHPQRATGLVLIDGGLPLDTPAGVAVDDLVAAILGPTAARLRMRFDDVTAYVDFWREHPAFGGTISPQLQSYFAYDLVTDGDRLRPATRYEVTAADTVDLTSGRDLAAALDALAAMSEATSITTWITVARGLQNEPPGLYSPADVERLIEEFPAVSHVRWSDLNHYTVVMNPRGAHRVAELIHAALAEAQRQR